VSKPATEADVALNGIKHATGTHVLCGVGGGSSDRGTRGGVPTAGTTKQRGRMGGEKRKITLSGGERESESVKAD